MDSVSPFARCGTPVTRHREYRLMLDRGQGWQEAGEVSSAGGGKFHWRSRDGRDTRLAGEMPVSRWTAIRRLVAHTKRCYSLPAEVCL